ncbi:hypothetical protein GGH12_005438 [Coemansia sp. RSA 1822]|nr:hypothetical protein LPJ76_005567 [Coemansia sp. RSA 638]KAJ2125039.1 hypothetical protein IW147_001169 [Coemansia sp. RSA 720]KAJ2543435.1 hypothetical protein GGF49_002040 [Coemansia sp. RSA 1853]KAJ2559326.1 hypothetical protein GGH12_005438 [Coemansia sp. RSA 1822]
MNEPCPRFSPNCATKPTLPAGQGYDYSIKNPIDYNAPVFKSEIPWPQPVASWTAGQPVTVKFQPDGAAHGGGHCQFAISYDNGKTAAIVHKVMKHCFFNGPSDGNAAEVLQYTFNLPADVPASSKAQFIWIWTNAIGNRELYTGIADISIANPGGSTSYTGKSAIYPNHKGYETIPAFGGDYTTGLSLYDNAPNVTISSSGYAAEQPSKYTAEQPPKEKPTTSKSSEPSSSDSTFEYSSVSPSPKAPALPVIHNAAVQPSTSTDSETPSSTAPSAKPTSNQSTSGECEPGTLQCNDDGSGFRICTWGRWSDGFTCAQGTVCKTSDLNSVYCGWP